jgi:hypothetical protein
LDELLRKMPLCSAATSIADFDFKWRHWQVNYSKNYLVLLSTVSSGRSNVSVPDSLIPVPDPAWIQGFDDQLEKIYGWKKI